MLAICKCSPVPPSGVTNNTSTVIKASKSSAAVQVAEFAELVFILFREKSMWKIYGVVVVKTKEDKVGENIKKN